MGKSIFAELRASREFFTRVEQKIAGAILDNPRWFVACTMAELATELEISQGSINNFARKFSGGRLFRTEAAGSGRDFCL